jgi:hypothetical protein
MSSRRTHLTTLGLGLLAGAVAAPAPARAVAPTEGVPAGILAKRKQITLPAVPALGLTYIATFDLTDPAGAPLGTAAANTAIVDLRLEGPVILSQVVLQLAGGELHYQRLMNRFGEYPRSGTGVIVGGSGEYAEAQGVIEITWPDADTIHLRLPQPPPPPRS